MAFSFGGVPALFSAPGACRTFLEQLPKHSAPRWLLVTDPGIRALGLEQDLWNGLSALGPAFVFDEVRPEPKVESVDALAACLRKEKVTGLVALGGGSVMDVAKLAAVVAELDVPASQCLLGQRNLPPSSLTTVMVPTTAGTGSEVTRTGIYSLDGTKLWAWGDGLLPNLVVHDPTLSTQLPSHLTAATGVDALVHAVEAWSGGRPSPMVELFAARAVLGVLENLPKVLRNPLDLEGRAGMLMAASYAGVAIDNGGTGVAHAVGHALGSIGAIHHGKAVAIAMGATLPWNVEAAPDSFSPLASLLGRKVTEVPHWFRGFVDEVGLDRRLGWDWDREAFGGHLVSPENLPMLQNNAYPLDATHGSMVCKMLESWLQ